MKRFFMLIAAAAFGFACDPATLPSPKTEADAYQVALDANDSSAIALDVATLALHALVEADADRRAATCKGAGADLAACKNREALEALANGKRFADGIDLASAKQIELRNLLVEYQKCTPGTVDRFCQADAIAKAVAKSPEVKQAVEEARKKLRNVRSPK